MKLVVLGAAESGVGAAILAQHKGYEVFVSDRGTIRSHYKSLLDAHGLPWEEGTHTAERILDADEVVKSPGIPDDAPMVKALVEKGIPVISELEFAARYTQAKLLCITGSNGKTTTTSLIYHILREAGYNVELAGNIGRSMALRVAENDEKGDPDWFVLEISSFQLDNMYDFRANIAVLLNITPDHLDRYGYVMQRYVESKMRIIRNQQPEDYFVYWADDEYVPGELARHAHAAQLLPFADHPRSDLPPTAVAQRATTAMVSAKEHNSLSNSPALSRNSFRSSRSPASTTSATAKPQPSPPSPPESMSKPSPAVFPTSRASNTDWNASATSTG